MSQVRMFACAGAGLALATLGWLMVAVDGMSAGLLSRSAGVALFGAAMLAASLVFRAAMRSSESPAARTATGAGEFRRGFDRRAKVPRPGMRASSQKEIVVALRRAVAAEAQRPQAYAASVTLSANQIERIHSLLHVRAAALRARDAE